MKLNWIINATKDLSSSRTHHIFQIQSNSASILNSLCFLLHYIKIDGLTDTLCKVRSFNFHFNFTVKFVFYSSLLTFATLWSLTDYLKYFFLLSLIVTLINHCQQPVQYSFFLLICLKEMLNKSGDQNIKFYYDKSIFFI